jgi:predicted signal transduction protein with EAL and GGDEF domain
MGRNLHITVVAEGVETIEQERFLVEHRCDQLQGLLFSAAVSRDTTEALLALSPPAPTFAPCVADRAMAPTNELSTLVQRVESSFAVGALAARSDRE